MRVVFSFVVAIVFAAAPGAQRLIYPPSDPAADIASALSLAKRDGRNVLIDFGADWCPDCRVLGALFEDPKVAPFLEKHFHVVHVDVGRRDKNAGVVEKYGATSDAWIPAVVVLDAAGKTVGITDETLRLTRRDTPDTLLKVLEAWAPKARVATVGAFAEHGVHVALDLERDDAGATWIAATFTPLRSDVHLYAADLPADGIDGMGRPTRLVAAPGSGVRLVGRPVVNRAVRSDRIDALGVSLPVYPAGDLTLRQRIVIDRPARAGVAVTFMGCGAEGCLPPVVGRKVELELVR